MSEAEAKQYLDLEIPEDLLYKLERLAAWYYTGNGRDDTEETWFDYYTAPHPWGPWRLADKQKNNPEGWYCPRILTTGQERTGNTLRLKLVTGGDWKNLNIYKYVTIPLTLTGE